MRRFRLHFIIMANEFHVPRSFRTEAYACDHGEAWEVGELYVSQQRLTGLTIERVSSDMVPTDPTERMSR